MPSARPEYGVFGEWRDARARTGHGRLTRASVRPSFMTVPRSALRSTKSNGLGCEHILTETGVVKNSTTPACYLCGSEGEIVESHGIPAFAGRWIRETSATGFLRGYHEPNQRIQDLPTVRLLCQACEQRFSAAEKKFSELLFRPFLTDGRSRFPYEEWLLYFAVSLAWRCLAISNREGLGDHPHHIGAVNCARDTWAAYLLGRAGRAGPYRFNRVRKNSVSK